ncbi:PNGase F N-terminal domain-containing protein [Flavobacterium aciduliphilum]|uniref:PNGase F N-terminal domain-containing protein n=1 Tax=Flavobacterium aciduliphilum TaxID=1101402 RepID=UPI002936F3FE|nr:PNGase F N-terminal domain-containing protein [Flavobacterium aciduliphilum]
MKSSNGKVIENPIVVFSNDQLSLITSESIMNGKSSFPFEQTLITNDNYFQITNLNHTKTIATKDSTSISKQKFELMSESKKILGFNCKKAKTVINSNTIELWYTNEIKIKGSPTLLGHNLGLVLETIRNGNFKISAINIEKTKEIPTCTFDSKKIINSLTYKDIIWKSKFVTIPVFKDEIINFSDETKSNDSIMRFAHGTIILKKVKIPKISKGSQIFLDLTEQSNGDAYDRTGVVFIIPTDKKFSFYDGLENGINMLPIYNNGNGKQYRGIISTNEFNPIIELMRFFTPFGIKQYNTIQLKDKTWEECVLYRQEISECAQALNEKDVYIGTFIGNYDKGGHKVSVNITIHPEEENTVAKTYNIIPLFCTTNIMEMGGQEYSTLFNSDKGLFMTFTLDKALKNARLRYITTGHGGWENGDEFIPKKNTIYLDNNEIFHFTPWREDCGAFRLYNPASGNFDNGLSSSDYSRSNWCPGTSTNPIYIELGDLTVGTHTLQIKIPQGPNEGNSFSSWNVSGLLFGE